MSRPSDGELCRRIETAFASRFGPTVCLTGGWEEPLYLPAVTPAGVAEVRYVRDYPRSALHECAHWCLAGRARRQLPDFGYWYVPAAQRSAQQQAAFERLEVAPQALEAVFCEGFGLPFQVSLDNLEIQSPAAARFSLAVGRQGERLRRRMPRRAAQLLAALGGQAADWRRQGKPWR